MGLANMLPPTHTNSAITPGAQCQTPRLRRFRSMVPPRPGIVSIFADGSVIVTCAGAEMGQGMFTKVKQVRLAVAQV